MDWWLTARPLPLYPRRDGNESGTPIGIGNGGVGNGWNGAGANWPRPPEERRVAAMSEFSDFRVVHDAAELAGPSATNGTHGANGTQSADGYNGTNGHNGAHTNVPAGEFAGVGDSFAVSAEAVSLGVASSESVGFQDDMWQADLPQLRIGTASVSHPSAADARPVVSDAAPVRVYDPDAHPPRLLRAVRFLFGLILLLGAWLATASMLMLGSGLTGGLPSGMDFPFQMGLYVLTALGAAWLTLVGLACLAAGAFALTLALTARGW